MQRFRGRYIYTWTATSLYRGEYAAAGRSTAQEIIGELEAVAFVREPFLPQLAIVLFTQPHMQDETGNRQTAALRELCDGINAGLGSDGSGKRRVPVIGCSVAAIPDIETRQIIRDGFSITVLAARARDLAVGVAGAQGFVTEMDGHVKAWDICQRAIEEQEASLGEQSVPDKSFILAFFPGLVEAATDFKLRQRVSYRALRDRVGSDYRIYGAGAGEFGQQKRSHIMAGDQVIENGHACANVRTALRIEMSMSHNLQLQDETLQVVRVKEDDPKSIVSFAGRPDYKEVSAADTHRRLREKGLFVFHVLDITDDDEQLSFVSVPTRPAGDVLRLLGPVKLHSTVRPAYVNKDKTIFARGALERLVDGDAPVAVALFLTCTGAYRLLGDELARDEIVRQQLQRIATHPQSTTYCAVTGFVFGEWGMGKDLDGQAQYYHTTTLAIADELTPQHHQRRQLALIESCSRSMSEALLRAEVGTNPRTAPFYKQRLTTHAAAKVLSGPLFETIVDLGYDGGLISLVDEINQTIVGTEACGPVWERLKPDMVVRLDDEDLVAESYRSAAEKSSEHIEDCRQHPGCHRERQAGIVSQTILPLWDGSRCFGVLQVGHGPVRAHLPEHERNALSNIARNAALHLSRIKMQETIRELEAAARFAISHEDQEAGWCYFARFAARAVEVPYCLIRILAQSGSALQVAGGTDGLFSLTFKERPFTDIRSGTGPVVEWFRAQDARDSQAEIEPYVRNVAAGDRYLEAIIANSVQLKDFYRRIGSYVLGPIVLPESRLVGVISFMTFRSAFFDSRRVELVRKIADLVSIIARTYMAASAARALAQTTSALTNLQEKIDGILRAVGDGRDSDDYERAAQLLVNEVAKIFPCEACTLHRFESRADGYFLTLAATAPEGSAHKKTQWNLLDRNDQGLLLYLATQNELFKGSGEALRKHHRIRDTSGVWKQLPKTQTLHSILAIPLVNPDGRHYGVLTLYNRLSEENLPHDLVDFSDVPTQVRISLKEIATSVLESLESRDRLARLHELADAMFKEADAYSRSAVPPDPEAVMSRVAESIAKAFGAKLCSIFLVTPPDNQLQLRGCFGWRSRPKVLSSVTYRIGEGLTGAAAEASKAVVIPSNFADTRRSGKYFRDMYGAEDLQNTYEMICLPLQPHHGGAPAGVITVHRELPREYARLLGLSDRGSPILEVVSILAAFAVSIITGEPGRADAVEDPERPAIAEILSVLTQKRTPVLPYEELALQIAVHFGAEFCGIFLPIAYDRNVLELRGANGDLARYINKIRIERHEGPVGEAFRSATTQYQDAFDDSSYTGPLDGALRDVLIEPPRNLRAAPMCLGPECSGVIVLINERRKLLTERARTLRKYNIEAVGTGILLGQADIELAATIREQQEVIASHERVAMLESCMIELKHEAGKQLTHVIGALDNLRHPELPADSRLECLDRIQESYKTFTATVDRIDATIEGSREREVIDVLEIIRSAVNHVMARPDACGISLQNDATVSSFVRGPRIQFTKILSSILDNALESDAKAVHIELQLQENRVGVSVSDDGDGIEESNLPRLFVKGFTTKKRVPGTERGYGLNVAKIVLLSEGGELEVVKGSGGGTRVTMWLQKETGHA